ncbi:DUF6048 family protein [Eudoraea chungangensis]|uniref:DUF6048 family protein n=1 Tax=Eudoraea chungangensis TaxID=1481905 RepID=UPI0023EAA2E5|nr:DUF6048 family protein [Eudoraea chungangensis]
MSKSIISLVFLFLGFLGRGQSDSLETKTKDSTKLSERYGLRVGIDLSKPIRGLIDENYMGLEVVADFRITHRLNIAAEIGNEEFTDAEILDNADDINVVELYNYTSSGSYLKLGVDFNTYENWYGMSNAIIIGGRYVGSTFSQTLNSNTVYDSNRYWVPNGFAEGFTARQEFKSLNASWLEFLVGIKVELFANFYLSASARLAYLFTNKEAEGFPNLWIPGYGRVSDNSNFGANYNYSISYFIPIFKKKTKKPKEEPPVTE